MESRSKNHFLHSTLDVNTWRARPPTVDQARPARCPACRAPSRVPGLPLGLHGHGLRTRQLRGPRSPDAPPTLVTLQLRRYRCQHCDAVLTVAPRDLLPHRLFAASAIALALALWSLLRLTARAVRARISPWRHVGHTAAAQWLQLRRWAQQLPRLFPTLRVPERTATPRARAARAATTLVGFAPPRHRHEPLEAQAFAGALEATA